MPKNVDLKIFLIILASALFKVVAPAQDINYREIFSGHWDAAEEFVKANEKWMRTECENNNIPYSFAVAVVFPELVRYSALRDKIEISILKTLYINLGEEYADFSVGPFQMKPSFAESVTEEIALIDERKLRKQFRNKNSFKDLRDYRSAVVKSLEDVKKEFNYLIAFIKLCDHRFPSFWENTDEKLDFYSTAYNCGLKKDPAYIKSMEGKKFFSTRLFKGETYSYCEISRFWYYNHQDIANPGQ